MGEWLRYTPPMAYIEKRQRSDGKVSYRAQVRVKGFPPQARTFQRRHDAVKWSRQVEAAIDERRLSPSTVERKRCTLASVIDDYLEDGVEEIVEGARRDRRNQLAWWRKRLGEIELQWLRPADVAPAIRDLRKGGSLGGSPVSASTCNRYLASISAVLSWAVKRRTYGLANNPLRGALLTQKEPSGRVRFLDESERDRLLEACKGSVDQRLYLLVALAITTGMRRSELLRLRWRHLDFERGLISITRSKNREHRSVGVAGVVLRGLKERAASRKDADERVFQPLPGQAQFPRKAWENAMAEADLEDFRFHDLRHTAASYLAMNGASPTEIAEILGHRTLAMVKRYAHLTEKHTVAVSQRMAERFVG